MSIIHHQSDVGLLNNANVESDYELYARPDDNVGIKILNTQQVNGWIIANPKNYNAPVNGGIIPYDSIIECWFGTQMDGGSSVGRFQHNGVWSNDAAGLAGNGCRIYGPNESGTEDDVWNVTGSSFPQFRAHVDDGILDDTIRCEWYIKVAAIDQGPVGQDYPFVEARMNGIPSYNIPREGAFYSAIYFDFQKLVNFYNFTIDVGFILYHLTYRATDRDGNELDIDQWLMEEGAGDTINSVEGNSATAEGGIEGVDWEWVSR